MEIEEFLMGCLRLKGQAKSMDVVKVMHDQAGVWLCASFFFFFWGGGGLSARGPEFSGLFFFCECFLVAF